MIIILNIKVKNLLIFNLELQVAYYKIVTIKIKAKRRKD